MRALIALLANLMLYLIVRSINDSLAPHLLYIYVAALYIVLPGLYLNAFTGLAVVAITGLIIDSSLLINFGTSMFLFLIGFVIIRWVRSRVGSHIHAMVFLITQLTNIALFLSLSFVLHPTQFTSLAYWKSIFINLIFSQLCLALIQNWFFNLQYFGWKILNLNHPQQAHSK